MFFEIWQLSYLDYLEILPQQQNKKKNLEIQDKM